MLNLMYNNLYIKSKDRLMAQLNDIIGRYYAAKIINNHGHYGYD